MINELFAEAGDEFRENLSDIPTEKLSLLVQAGRGGGFTESNARYTILAKYEEFLTILDRPSFNRGAEVYQNASCLIALRNALIHHEPEWQPAATKVSHDRQHQLHQALRGKFEPSPMTAEGNPFYPDKCLGHGGATWALNSAVAFADRFVQLAEISCPFDHVRARLGTKFEA